MIKEADVISYSIDNKFFNLKNNETYRLRNIIYENNPKNIADNGGVMNFDKKIDIVIFSKKILNIKRFK